MLYWLVLCPILIGVAHLTFGKKESKLWVIAVQIGIVLYTTYLYYRMDQEGTIINHLGGYPESVAITLRANDLTIVFLWITTLLFLGLYLYGYFTEYFDNYTGFLYLTLESIVLALLMTSDLFNIYVLLEVSTIIIALLITSNREQQAVYNSMIYLFVTVISSSFWLFGTGMLYRTFGYFDLEMISEVLTQVEDPRSLILPFGFLLSAVSTKIALFPLHGWLPKAYSAPSAPPIVPAVLSGIYEAAALYLFLRVITLFSEVIPMNNFLLIIGFISAIFGFLRALIEDDIYMVLAYSTISQIGLIVIGMATGTEDGLWGSIYHILAHALFKSTLFLVTGDLIRYYGTRDINKIRGVMKTLPVTATAFVLGLLGLTGAPFFNGAVSKNMIGAGIYSDALYYLLNVITLGTIIYSFKLGSVLIGENELSKEVREADQPKDYHHWITLSFGLVTMLTGVFGETIMSFLFDYQVEIELSDHLQHGLIYILLVALGYFLFSKYKQNKHTMVKVLGINLSFNSMIRALVLYFITLIGYMYWMI